MCNSSTSRIVWQLDEDTGSVHHYNISNVNTIRYTTRYDGDTQYITSMDELTSVNGLEPMVQWSDATSVMSEYSQPIVLSYVRSHRFWIINGRQHWWGIWLGWNRRRRWTECLGGLCRRFLLRIMQTCIVFKRYPKTTHLDATCADLKNATDKENSTWVLGRIANIWNEYILLVSPDRGCYILYITHLESSHESPQEPAS